MEEKKENPRILSIIRENGKTYYLCNDGFIYEANEEQTNLKRLGNADKELVDKIMARFEHEGVRDIDESTNDAEIEGR